MQSNWKKTLGLAIAITFVTTNARALPYNLEASRPKGHGSVHASTWNVSHPIETRTASHPLGPVKNLLFPHVKVATLKEDPHPVTGGAGSTDGGSHPDTCTRTGDAGQGQETVRGAGAGQVKTGGVGSNQDVSAPLCKRAGGLVCTDEDASEAAPLDPIADAAAAEKPDPIKLNVNNL